MPIGRTAIRMIDKVSILTSGSMARSEKESEDLSVSVSAPDLKETKTRKC